MKREYHAFTILFFSMIFLCAVSYVVLPVRERSEEENRSLSGWPGLSIESLWDGSFEQEFEEALNDQFVLRNVSIKINTWWNRLLGRRLIGGVLYADDYYMIEHKEPDGVEADRLEDNIDTLAQSANMISEVLGQDAVHIYFVPSKENFLKDKLPAHVTAYDGSTIGGLVSQQVPRSMVTDLQEAISKTKEQVFYYTDHHWTTFAAYQAYRQWCSDFRERPVDCDLKLVTDHFLGTTHSKTLVSAVEDKIWRYEPKSDVTVSYPEEYEVTDADGIFQDDKLETKDKYAVFFGGNTDYIKIHNENGNGKRMVLFKDSFSNSLVPFMAEHVSDILMVDLRYADEELSDKIKEFGVPDIVLYIFSTENIAEDHNLYKLSTLHASDFSNEEPDENKTDKEDEEELDEDDDIFI